MTSTRRRRPTLDDVAEAVGVSRATVSNAYNRPDQLSTQLREQVLRAAKELGYPGPNPTARSLATSRTGAIAFLLDASLSAAFSDPALSITLDALAKAVEPGGHALLLLPGAEAHGGPPAERVLAAQADIAVAYSLADGTPALQTVHDRGLPLVVIDQPLLPDTARVGCDDRGGAALAARHLLELGHRRFAILSAPRLSDGPSGLESARASSFHGTRERLAGYLSALSEAGISDVAVSEAPWLSADTARASAVELLHRSPRPTALLCMSDQLALAAVAAARQLGLHVPSDVSVVGFDDTPQAAWAEPPLTTVRQDLAGKGRTAGELALHLLDGGAPPPPVVLPVSLIRRNSTAPV
ncbi:LacI family DNA-binding transcriptional regulator [Amycolatopsis sp. FDAARGOS 1241]|uniref:LacI family DNA-binding transcriptional regulator n=1 Tax=Amycolatopsis sp. FDAARGOS 1241 TaxID=2778070 RepID=UPI00194E0A7B|nr:LacI family DNA-binding transcriptional regulator [Amycolatopsis sp. FDAARGOS 1241]QRP48192.1 LacI family DNA-binding transcriptional regulator [Amycolatopsis sp. FDAARGOS 1241]